MATSPCRGPASSGNGRSCLGRIRYSISSTYIMCSHELFTAKYLYSSSAAAGSSWLSKLVFSTSLFSSLRPPVSCSSPSTVRIFLRKFQFSSQSCRALRSSSHCLTSSRRVLAIQVQFYAAFNLRPTDRRQSVIFQPYNRYNSAGYARRSVGHGAPNRDPGWRGSEPGHCVQASAPHEGSGCQQPDNQTKVLLQLQDI